MAAPRRIVFLDRNTVVADFRPPSFPHEWVEHLETAPEDVVQRLQGAGIVITNKVRIKKEVLDAVSSIGMIAVAATGVDIIDLESCRARGIAVANVRGYATTSVPEHAILMMLALRKNVFALRRDVEKGVWQRARTFCILDHRIDDLSGATLGIIGHGELGRATAKIAAAFGMRVLISERKGRTPVRAGRTSFDSVLAESDVISLHAPLTYETRNLIGRAELERMKPTAILINTARGGLVDERALAERLQNGRIGGAGIDVLEREPPHEGSALLSLAHLPNVLVTPHVAWASRATMQRLADQVVDNIEAFVRGESKNRVV